MSKHHKMKQSVRYFLTMILCLCMLAGCGSRDTAQTLQTGNAAAEYHTEIHNSQYVQDQQPEVSPSSLTPYFLHFLHLHPASKKYLLKYLLVLSYFLEMLALRFPSRQGFLFLYLHCPSLLSLSVFSVISIHML